MRWNEDRMKDSVQAPTSMRTYGSVLQEAVDRLSQAVLGKRWDEQYRSPGVYTGELLAMEYLYSQTGISLTPTLHNQEEEDQLVEDIDDEDIEDEGFEEETEDITVPVLTDDDHDIERRPSTTRRRAPSPPPLPELPSTSTGGGQRPVAAAAVPSTSGQGLHPAATAAATTSGAQGVVVGPDGIPGWDKVQELAAYLVDLRDAAYLTEPQVTEVIQLWAALPDSDKERIDYQPRHQERLSSGRFKAPKRSGVTPGVESVKRSLIGHPGGPAQWPGTSRLVDAMCTRLCTLHKCTTRKAGVSTPRWTRILDDYHHIRDLIIASPRLMADTTIQLFQINQRTLIQWFQQRLKGQEMSTLTQGLTPAPQIPVAPAQLPQPQEKLIVPPASSGQRHEFVFPPNLEGRAPLLRPGRRPKDRQDRPIAPTPPPIFPLPATLGTSALPVPTPFTLVQLPAMTVPAPPVPFLQLPATTLAASTPGAAPSVPAPPPPAGPPPPPAGPPPPVSRYTERNRRRRAAEEASGSAEKRKYVRGATYNMCSQCGKPKTKEYGHSCFGSATFCSQASGGKSVEEWLEEQRAQK
ncbi:uncharacterized protein LOC132884527 [Neoarius graeffei]|uniref:uncharacterized protein LOC132884527 n=1 Tax=Neoarius graeffei TaxID=443677 RepID=UPI00298C149F|nr:uncharacterized protein LOC132884527 [Neoarius graeffei]